MLGLPGQKQVRFPGTLPESVIESQNHKSCIYISRQDLGPNTSQRIKKFLKSSEKENKFCFKTVLIGTEESRAEIHCCFYLPGNTSIQLMFVGFSYEFYSSKSGQFCLDIVVMLL